MGIKYDFRDASGSALIPVDGSLQQFDLLGMSGDLNQHYPHIVFLNANGDIVNPTSTGNVTFLGSQSADPYVFDGMVNGEFPANTTQDDARERPIAGGPMVAARLILDSVSGNGVTHCKAMIWGY
ncbi:MAG: hypothetical protein Tp138OMZ00d2C19078241_22 [Prokaryotic dsDNA virus sp.]|jgi:hypothetical protein|nr:MAG: hypothetical protein Tp138OMZ00d2C19078241_22 [Prokaryotic dsDNA virus sp.]|tara:strand:- start:35136 stop:35510 length:375 start_codon:yes stop_codon:yes gene_type:complete